MNLFAYIGYIGGIATTIVGVIKFIEFRNDRKGKLVVKLEFYDEYGLFGSTKKPYFILTITNIGKSIRQIFTPTINHQFGKMMYEPTTRIIEYPHKLESGDQLVIETDFDLIGVQFLAINQVQKNTGRRPNCKFEIQSEVKDTYGAIYKSNKLYFKG